MNLSSPSSRAASFRADGACVILLGTPFLTVCSESFVEPGGTDWRSIILTLCLGVSPGHEARPFITKSVSSGTEQGHGRFCTEREPLILGLLV